MTNDKLHDYMTFKKCLRLHEFLFYFRLFRCCCCCFLKFERSKILVVKIAFLSSFFQHSNTWKLGRLLL